MFDGKRRIAYIGARTTVARNARGNGLNVYRAEADAPWRHLQLLEMENPSFLTFDRTSSFLYAVHGDGSEVTAFAIDETHGLLTILGQQTTQGRNPVHLAFDPTNRFLVVANHFSSSLALMPRLDDGRLAAPIHLLNMTGTVGPHRVEQPFAKPHQVEFDPTGRFIIVPDKGLDSVFVFRIDYDRGRLVEVSKTQCREGSGPRHVAFAPGGRWAYVINELDSTVTSFRFDPDSGTLDPFQILPSLPDTFTGNSRGSEIMVCRGGDFVYASNRGHDSIVGYAVGADNRLHPIGWWHTHGKTPRYFTIPGGDPDMIVLNEDSDCLVGFDANPVTGSLSEGRPLVDVGSPVCLLMKELGAKRT